MILEYKNIGIDAKYETGSLKSVLNPVRGTIIEQLDRSLRHTFQKEAESIILYTIDIFMLFASDCCDTDAIEEEIDEVLREISERSPVTDIRRVYNALCKINSVVSDEVTTSSKRSCVLGVLSQVETVSSTMSPVYSRFFVPGRLNVVLYFITLQNNFPELASVIPKYIYSQITHSDAITASLLDKIPEELNTSVETEYRGQFVLSDLLLLNTENYKKYFGTRRKVTRKLREIILSTHRKFKLTTKHVLEIIEAAY